jgi:hypothetical protein
MKKLEDITEEELFNKNCASYNQALTHYHGDFTKEWDLYKEVLGITEFPKFDEYFILVYIPMLHITDVPKVYHKKSSVYL